MRGLIAALVVFFSLCASGAAAQTPPSRFTGWASAIVAADWRDGAGQPIEAFDNALTDLTAAFQAAGFAPEAMVSATLRPDAEPAFTPTSILARITETTQNNTTGCFLYFTSHGSRTAMVFGNQELAPADLAPQVRNWCGARPTVIVISACFSGIFVDSLKAPNRMILTAASRERSSFGCGAGERYPWFDACVLESLPDAGDFLALAAATRACVVRREAEAGIELSSDPQMFVGGEMQMRLPTLRFTPPPPS